MKHVKLWEEKEDDYAFFTSPSNKEKPKNAFKGCCGYCGEFGHKAADCPNLERNQNKNQKAITQQKKKPHGKGDSKGKGHLDMSTIKCFSCGEYGIFPMTAQKHAIMLILLKKVSKMVNWNLCWIWIVVVYAKSVQWFVQSYKLRLSMRTK